MLRKPWPIVILALVHILSPIYNAVYSAFLLKISVADYWSALWSQLPLWRFVLVMSLQPIAGIAIWAVKRWSYAVFLLAYCVQNFMTYQNHARFPDVLSLGGLIAIFALNIGVVGFFLHRAVRAPYFNPRLRWWESKPRYLVNFAVNLFVGGRNFKGTITDLSEGGVFIAEPSEQPKMGEDIRIEFATPGGTHKFMGRVVHIRDRGNKGFGVQFDALDWGGRQEIREVVAAAVAQGASLRNKPIPWHQDLKSWLTRLLTTGKGIVPEVPGGKKNDAA